MDKEKVKKSVDEEEFWRKMRGLTDGQFRKFVVFMVDWMAKQLPKEIAVKGDSGKCPSCGFDLWFTCIRYKHCYECGQALAYKEVH